MTKKDKKSDSLLDLSTHKELRDLQNTFQESLEEKYADYQSEGSGTNGKCRDFAFWIEGKSFEVFITRTPNFDIALKEST